MIDGDVDPFSQKRRGFFVTVLPGMKGKVPIPINRPFQSIFRILDLNA